MMSAQQEFVLLDRGEEYKNMNEKITVYSKPGCKQCSNLKLWLDAKSIEYSEVDVTQDKDSLDKIISANRLSLPVLEINEEFVDYKVYNDILEMV